ncbi:MAG: 3'-5' exonuclease, partial [Rhodothermales bacterium]|nr:3'-5' exonuclease [Rhodothermales bacterium]
MDEFQDTDAAQRDIVYALGRGVPRPQLFLVGDPKQSIYRFRGADISVWNEVEREMREDGRVLPLTRNFRSTPAVVDFANRAAAGAMEATGRALEAESPGSVVAWAKLEPGRDDDRVGAVEWLDAPDVGKAANRRTVEADAMAARIQALVDGGEEVIDPDEGAPRPCRYRDIAVLYRTGTGMHLYEDALARHGIPYYTAAPPDLDERQEVADLLNALRLLDDPRNDLFAFAFLRSPFVGLRDEVVARIRLLGEGGPLLRQARRFLAGGASPFPAPEHPEVAALETEALRRGLGALDEARSLVSRAPLDEVARLLLERTGYRAHLVLLDEHREAVAHLETFLRHLEAHRHLLPGTFLEMWDRRDRADQGLPAAPLHSKEDDVVTFSTMHRAKGLEWPVVFVVDVAGETARHNTGQWVRDGELGPVLER